MDENILKYFAGTLSSAEHDVFFKQLEADEAMKAEFIRLQNLYALSGLSNLSIDEEDGKKGYRIFQKRLKYRNRRRRLQHVFKYAAVVLLLIGSTVFFTKYLDQDSFNDYEYQTLFVPAGQRAKLTLPDGSTVWLNAQSTLKYPARFNGKKRTVELVGEAYFDIAQNKKKPFVVTTQNVEMEVLGTEFNVYSYPETGYVQTDLIEGALKVSDITSRQLSVTLKPNEQATFKDGKIYVGESAYSDYFLWKDGIYTFENESLLDILEKLQLYYDVKIVVEDPGIFDVPYTGKFRQRDGIDEILKIIQKIQPFKIEKDTENNVIILTE